MAEVVPGERQRSMVRQSSKLGSASLRPGGRGRNPSATCGHPGTPWYPESAPSPLRRELVTSIASMTNEGSLVSAEFTDRWPGS